jgi:hypothetical protein
MDEALALREAFLRAPPLPLSNSIASDHLRKPSQTCSTSHGRVADYTEVGKGIFMKPQPA